MSKHSKICVEVTIKSFIVCYHNSKMINAKNLKISLVIKNTFITYSLEKGFKKMDHFLTKRIILKISHFLTFLSNTI